MTVKNNFEAPFPGLRPYAESESEYFFSREREVEDVLSIVQKHKLVIITGQSGSGKSSLINAGIKPKLRKKFSGQSGKDWKICYLRPGIAPLENLSYSLSETGALYLNGKSKTTDHRTYKSIIEKNQTLGLIDIYRNSEIYEKENLLIIVDQLEDLFRFDKFYNSEKTAEANLLFDLVYRTCRFKETSIYFILSVNSSYIALLNQYNRFSELINYTQFNLPNLGVNSIQKIIENTFHKKNVQISNSIIESLGDACKDSPTVLSDVQLLFQKLYFTYASAFNKSTVYINPDNIYVSEGYLNIFEKEAETFFSNLDEDGKKNLELLFRSTCNANSELNSDYYQNLNYLVNYLNKDINFLTDLIKEAKIVFGETLDVFKSIIKGTDINIEKKYYRDYILNIKYQPVYKWTKFRIWSSEEQKNYSIYKEINSKAIKYPEESLLSGPSLNIAISWKNNDLINKNWAEKYDLNFSKTIDYIADSQRICAEEKEKQEQSKKDIEVAKIRVKNFQWIGVVLFLVIIIMFGFNRHREAEEQAVIAIEMEKKNNILEMEKEKIDDLNTNIINLRKKDSVSIAQNETEYQSKLKFVQNRLKTQKELERQKILNQKQKLKDKEEFLNIKDSLSDLLYELNSTTLNGYDRDKLRRITHQAINFYERINLLGNKLEIRFDDSVLRRIAINLVAKLNGENEYSEIKKYELIEKDRQPLRDLNVSGGGYFLSADNLGKLVYWDLNLKKTFSEIKELSIVRFSGE